MMKTLIKVFLGSVICGAAYASGGWGLLLTAGVVLVFVRLVWNGRGISVTR